MVIVVLFVPAALPWYYTWPLAVLSALAQSRQAIAADRRVLDLDHGDLQTRWQPWHVLMDPRAAGHGLRRGGVVLALQGRRVSTPSPGRGAPPRGPDGECSASTGRALSCRSTDPSRLMVSDGSGVNSQRTISVSLVSAVVQDDEQPGQALDHVAGVVEEDLRHHHRPFAADTDQVAFPQLLLDLGHRDAEQLGDVGQVVDVFAGIEHIVSGRNTAHRPESRTRDASSEALGDAQFAPYHVSGGDPPAIRPARRGGAGRALPRRHPDRHRRDVGGVPRA